MVRVVELAEARKRFEDALTYLADRYIRRMETVEWVEPASSEEAEKLFADAMAVVIKERRRMKGIKLRDDPFFRKRAIERGGAVIRDRVEAALDDWEAAWKEFRDVLVAIELPPKTVDFRANIAKRVTPIVEALIAKKKERKRFASAT